MLNCFLKATPHNYLEWVGGGCYQAIYADDLLTASACCCNMATSLGDTPSNGQVSFRALFLPNGDLSAAQYGADVAVSQQRAGAVNAAS